jgi:hypothetical protein
MIPVMNARVEAKNRGAGDVFGCPQRAVESGRYGPACRIGDQRGHRGFDPARGDGATRMPCGPGDRQRLRKRMTPPLALYAGTWPLPKKLSIGRC